MKRVDHFVDGDHAVFFRDIGEMGVKRKSERDRRNVLIQSTDGGRFLVATYQLKNNTLQNLKRIRGRTLYSCGSLTQGFGFSEAFGV